MKLLKPIIYTDGGPWAEHNYPCPVYTNEPAVLNLSTGIFEPSWKAQKEGYLLIEVKGRLRRWLIKKLTGEHW